MPLKPNELFYNREKQSETITSFMDFIVTFRQWLFLVLIPRTSLHILTKSSLRILTQDT